MAVYKQVFQVPYDPEFWDEDVAERLRTYTPGDPHGPHIKIYTGIQDAETGELCAQIRCKHHALKDVQMLADRVQRALPHLLGDSDPQDLL